MSESLANNNTEVIIRRECETGRGQTTEVGAELMVGGVNGREYDAAVYIYMCVYSDEVGVSERRRGVANSTYDYVVHAPFGIGYSVNRVFSCK